MHLLVGVKCPSPQGAEGEACWVGSPSALGAPDPAMGLPSVRRPLSWRGGDLNSGVYVNPRETKDRRALQEGHEAGALLWGGEAGKGSVSAVVWGESQLQLGQGTELWRIQIQFKDLICSHSLVITSP